LSLSQIGYKSIVPEKVKKAGKQENLPQGSSFYNASFITMQSI